MGEALSDTPRAVVSRGFRGEGTTLAEAILSMGLTEISARLLSGRYRPGVRDESWLRVPVVETPAAPTRPLLTLAAEAAALSCWLTDNSSSVDQLSGR